MPSPNIFNRRRISRRQTALALFLAGRDLDYVMQATGLKRTTAAVYLWEARQMHDAQQPTKRSSDDDLMQ